MRRLFSHLTDLEIGKLETFVDARRRFWKKNKNKFFFDVPLFFPHLHVVRSICSFLGRENVSTFFSLKYAHAFTSCHYSKHTHTYKGEKHAFSRSYSCPLSYILVPFWPVYNNIDEITNDGPIYRSKLLVFFICP